MENQNGYNIEELGEKIGKAPVKVLMKVIGNYLMLAFVAIALLMVAWFGGRRLFGWILQSISPFSQQRQEIAAKNNVRDAYSSVIGSDVDVISMNGFVKWFNNKEAKEIDISIPKLINYSPLFNDDTHRNDLKDAFSLSIDSAAIRQSTFKYNIYYDGATINDNGRNYRDVTLDAEKIITDDLILRVKNQEKLNFKKWDKEGKRENVDFKSKGDDGVTVDGRFSVGVLLFKKTYHLKAEYKYLGGHYELVKNSLKVEKIK